MGSGSQPACTGRIHLIRNPSGRPVARVWSRLIPLPAVVREAEPYQLECLSPAGQGGPGSSGFRLQAGSDAEGLLQGNRKEAQFLLC